MVSITAAVLLVLFPLKSLALHARNEVKHAGQAGEG